MSAEIINFAERRASLADEERLHRDLEAIVSKLVRRPVKLDWDDPDARSWRETLKGVFPVMQQPEPRPT